MDRQQILDILDKFKSDCGIQYEIVELGVFGSAARDRMRPQSDVDICVKTVTPNPFLIVHIKEALERRLARKVDIVRIREKMNPLLKSRIEQEAIYV